MKTNEQVETHMGGLVDDLLAMQDEMEACYQAIILSHRFCGLGIEKINKHVSDIAINAVKESYANG